MFNRLKTKVLNALHQTQVEPIYFGYIFAASVIATAMNNFENEKTCLVNLGINSVICEKMLYKLNNNITCNYDNDYSNTTYNDLKVIPKDPNELSPEDFQTFSDMVCKADADSTALISSTGDFRTQIGSLIQILMVLFAGSYIDRYHKRRIFIIIPLIGEIFACLSLVISAYYMNTIPMQFSNIAIIAIPAIFGSPTVLVIALLSHFVSNTTEDNRTYRIGILFTSMEIMGLIGQQLTDITYEYLGYFYSFILGTFLFALLVVYAAWRIHDKPLSEVNKSIDMNGVDNPTFEINGDEKMTPKLDNEIVANLTTVKRKNVIIDFFDPRMAFDTIMATFKKRNNHGRTLLLLAILAVIFSTLLGYDANFHFTYATSINVVKEHFQTISNMDFIFSRIATLLVSLYSKVMSDSTIAIFSIVSSMIARVIHSCAKSIITLYIATVWYSVESERMIIIIVMLTKLVRETEIGRILAVVNILPLIVNFCYTFVANDIYEHLNVNVYKGAYFLLSALICIPELVIFIILYFKVKTIKKIEDEQEQQKKVKFEENEIGEVTRL